MAMVAASSKGLLLAPMVSKTVVRETLPPSSERLLLAATCSGSGLFAAGRLRHHRRARFRRRTRAGAGGPRDSKQGESPVASWHAGRLEGLAESLDWSRCFISVLFVDSENTPSYVRARLAQRLADGAADWNGMSRVLEMYACSPRGEPEHNLGCDDPIPGVGVQAVISEFAENVGIERFEFERILRKLGAGMWSGLSEEDLREHDVIVALNDDAAAAVRQELIKQKVESAGRLMLLSDFEWYFTSDMQALTDASCGDGSGETFLSGEVIEALKRRLFEFGDSENFEVPPWPTQALGLNEKDGSLGDWRRLHGALLKGSWGLVWFLYQSWKQKYCNPLSKVLDHVDAIKQEPSMPSGGNIDS